MASSNNSIDPIYVKYHGAGFSPSLVLNFTPSFIISLLAIFFNSSLIYVTIKFRSTLHGSFNALIALESFGATLFELSQTIRFPISLTGINYIRADPLCFLIQIPLMGMELQFVSMLAIGIERLLCVLCPIWFKIHSKRPLKFLVLFTILIGFLLALLNISLLFMDIFIGELKGKEVMCAQGDGQGSKFRMFNSKLPMAINPYFQIGSVIIYALIWLIMLKAIIQKKKILNTYNLHILKSVSVMMVIIMFAWILQSFGPVYQSYIVLSREGFFIYFARMLDVMILAGALNAPILFIFSKQYRNCFKKSFPILQRNQNISSQNTNAVVPLTNLISSNVGIGNQRCRGIILCKNKQENEYQIS